MLGELSPAVVEPETADRDFWTRFHQLRRVRQSEMFPDDPLPPDDVVEKRMKKPSPYDREHYYEISRDGVMLSWFDAQHTTPANPEHETAKHLFWPDAYVIPGERRKGIATRWLRLVAQLMEQLGCTVVGFSSHQDTGHRFMNWLGVDEKLREIESRLRLSEVDWDLMRRWVDEGAKRNPQTRLEVYDEPLPDEMLPEFARQRSELLNTMPFENLEIGDIIVTPERMRFYYERMELVGEVEHEVLTREPNGLISGMTDISWAPFRRTVLEQQFTGVRPDARGRGLGKWIKAAMLLHVHDLYPDAEWVATGNAGSNAPMLKINRAMGFKAYRDHVEYQMTRDQLEARLNSA